MSAQKQARLARETIIRPVWMEWSILGGQCRSQGRKLGPDQGGLHARLWHLGSSIAWWLRRQVLELNCSIHSSSPSCVTLTKLVSHSKPEFSHLKKGKTNL